MSHSYRKLFSIPGAIRFSTAAFFGRLPAGMIGFSVILPLSELQGSYAIAGIVAASTMIGMALFAPLSGRLVDRYGQHSILFIFSILNFICTATLIASIQLGAALEILCIVGAATGASRLSTGTLARVRWAYVTQGLHSEQRQEMLQAAYAFESIIDEVVFISAPIFATLLCTAVHPLAGLMSCLIFFVVGAVALALQRSTQPPVLSVDEKLSSAFAIPGFLVVFFATFFIGISAGAVEVIVIARADDTGLRSLAGLLIATLAVSSVLAGFWYGARTFKRSVHSLWIFCLGTLFLALIPFIFATNLYVLALTLFFAGLSIAPTAISGQILTERILPTKLLNEGMNVVITAMILGMAVGAWFSGVFIDKLGAYDAGILPAIAVLIAFLIASVCTRLLYRSVTP